MPGNVVDRYRLVARLGEGGQGSVWSAEDPLHQGKLVALKLVSLRGAPEGTLERFRREARSLAKLSHPSLPACHALFEDLKHDVVGIALDLVDGRPLAALLASASFTDALRVQALKHLAGVLAYIHRAGLVHRDVKPQNVMVDDAFFDRPDDPSTVKLVDFGIVTEPDNPAQLTGPLGIIGTLPYLSPELLDPSKFKGPKPPGPERDVFAFGVLAFELLFGGHPTGLDERAAMADFIVAYRDGADTSFPPDLQGDPRAPWLTRVLALDPRERAADGMEILAALEGRSLKDAPTRPDRRRVPLATAPTELAVPLPPDTSATSVLFRQTSWRFYAALGALGLVCFAIAYRVVAKDGPSVGAPEELPGDHRAGMREEPPGDAPRAAVAPKTAVSLASAAVSAIAPPPPNVSASPDPLCPPGMKGFAAGSGDASSVGPVAKSETPASSAGLAAFCIDLREVTVADYKQCAACGPVNEAFWTGPTFTKDKAAEQTKNCASNRTGADDEPVTCVRFDDAARYCAAQGKRLPTRTEVKRARGVPSVCRGLSGLCPIFLWTRDSTRPGHRVTMGPSFRFPSVDEGSNIEEAKNDDLGFRCARDP